jgi:hypothetical protein
MPDPTTISPAAVTMATTEHFNLATARASTISETNGRASIFLASVSAGLVAIAFAGQSSQTALYVFGLVLFPVLSFLGLATFLRTLQTSIDDTIYIQRINRVRRLYFDAAPELTGYLVEPTSGNEESVGELLRREGYRAHRMQTLLSVPGTIGVLTSTLMAVTVGMAGAALTGDNLWVAAVLGLTTFAVAAPAHQRYQRQARPRAHAQFAADAFPPEHDSRVVDPPEHELLAADVGSPTADAGESTELDASDASDESDPSTDE